MLINIGMIALGCPKNQVDAEIMLASLKNEGFNIVPEESEADVIIVNTCGFIEDAKREAIENILEANSYKKGGKLKALIVTGCLAERYKDDILEEMQEVDVVVGIGKNGDICNIVREALKGERRGYYSEKDNLPLSAERLITTPFYTAYLKIAEGCDNCCTFCAIPQIRGRFRSRTTEDIISEAKNLASKGVKELVLVAQDTTRYGEDIYGEGRLPELLEELCKIEGIEWIRTLYTYPERITDRLLDVMAREEKIVKYLDIPLQHCVGKILKRMNRKGDKSTISALIEKIRNRIPDITLRTTLMTGFPGETEEDFEELCEFVKEMRFDRLGCFAYSEEENTPAALYEDRVEMQTRVDRSETVMNDQLTVVNEKNAQKEGRVLKVLIEGYDNYIRCYFGRAECDAPEIDGKVFFTTPHPLKIGDFVNVRINDTIEYDLLGELEE